MTLRTLWAALRRRLAEPYLKKQRQLSYSELVASVAHDTGLQPVQVRRVCHCLFDQLSLLIEHDQSFTSPVLSFKVITKPDQRRLARVVRRLPPAR